jgi:hypothetical protein
MSIRNQVMGAAGASSYTPTYIEDVFSNWAYDGNGSTQNIINGVDLATYGGLVWSKSRSAAGNHELIDTVRGAGKRISSDDAGAQNNFGDVSAFLTNGYSLSNVSGNINGSGKKAVSWSFRKQPKFFDVVEWNGNGVSGRQIPHSLGSVPGCIIVKCTSYGGNTDWIVYHRSIGNTGKVILNSTGAAGTGSSYWNNTSPTSTYFVVGSDNDTNYSDGRAYVAYLFAHDAGGFGLTGTDNVISCGSFTTDSVGKATVSLGYEPQFAIIKGSSAVTNWYTTDSMRGWTNQGDSTGSATILQPNTSDAEYANNLVCYPTSTGFFANMAGNTTYIYIAIRRGPMKVPTDATKVFKPVLTTGGNAKYTTGFPVDLSIAAKRDGGPYNSLVHTRLAGNKKWIVTSNTNAESTPGFQTALFDSNTECYVGAYGTSNPFVTWNFQRATGFFDEVHYIGTGSVLNLKHNLGVPPELIILKQRNSANNWLTATNFTSTTNLQLLLNSSTTIGTYNYNNGDWYASQPTATQFGLGGGVSGINVNGNTYVALLFASCPGVSKVGSYVGTGSDLTVNCGFASGARFVMIRRILYNTTPDSGNWWVFDSARGITTANDPATILNLTADESSLAGDYVAPTASGFIAKPGNSEINAANQTYIYLAIA